MNTLWQRSFFWGWLLTLVIFCNAGSRPIELRIIRSTVTNSCQFLSIQEAQFHKGLLGALANGQTFVIETSRYPSGSSWDQSADDLERLRLFSYDELILRDQARSVCGTDETNWDFTVFDYTAISTVYGDPSVGQLVLRPLSDEFPPLEIRPLVESGASKNRIDLVFFADGYTHDEKSQFFIDAARLANDISKNQTFYTVKPLLNIWAAFTPSIDSGIGIGGKPKDTPFGLYRDGTELRGVYYSKPDTARLACASMGDRCDYPILMGNDPLYGGIGGEFTVITPSLLNGALVLRHELGHSIIEIGEEYDGADEGGYFGCNAANKLEEIGWTHWLTNSSSDRTSDDGVHFFPASRVERMVMSLQQYPWTILNTTYSTKFRSPGTYPSNLIRFSISGIPKSDQLTVLLDGEDLGWKVYEGIGIDRYFYEFWSLANEDSGGLGLSQGEHEIKFVLNYPAAKEEHNMVVEGSGPQLCSLEVLEYGGVDEFNSTAGYYGIFPTFSEKNETSYRPTNEDCLMRAVTSPNFCKVCIEGLWIALMGRLDIVENVRADCYLGRSDDIAEEWMSTREYGGLRWKRSFEIDLLPLAQFRSNETLVDNEEAYEIVWSRTRGTTLTHTVHQYVDETRSSIWFERGTTLRSGDGNDKQIFHQFANSTRLVLDELDDEVRVGDVIGFDVKFSTEEVRVDVDGYLTGGGEWLVQKRCGY